MPDNDSTVTTHGDTHASAYGSPEFMCDAGVVHLFARYLRRSGILDTTQALFGAVRKSNKGLFVPELFKQMFCFLIDPANRFLVEFDRLKTDVRYARCIGTDNSRLASSHVVKRFYGAFSWPRIFRFRLLLQQLFAWRLHVLGPKILYLSIRSDTIRKHIPRHVGKQALKAASSKTIYVYKMDWGPVTVDATLRPQPVRDGRGKLYAKMLSHVVDNLQLGCSREVPVVLSADRQSVGKAPWSWMAGSGYGYILNAKPHKSHLDYALRQPHSAWCIGGNDTCDFIYLDVKRPPSQWAFPGRVLLYRSIKKADQMQFAFAPPEKAIYTDLGLGEPLDDLLVNAGRSDDLNAPSIINAVMGIMPGQQPRPPCKGIPAPRLPFMHLKPNIAYYYTHLAAWVLFESFKADLFPRMITVNAVKGPLNKYAAIS